ncbi:hypothetical protein AHAS_Ahas17G0199300 [Arachis hypogaea]
MAAVSTSFILTHSASSINKLDYSQFKIKHSSLSQNINRRGGVHLSSARRPLTIQAAYSEGGRPSGASIFVGGFLLGGLLVGTLGCVYAPQISKALAGADRKELMRKLPKFIYDEEKALEFMSYVGLQKFICIVNLVDVIGAKYFFNSSKILPYFALQKTRKVLAEKIAQLNDAIDDVSSQLRSEETPNGVAVNSDELEAAA